MPEVHVINSETTHILRLNKEVNKLQAMGAKFVTVRKITNE